MDKWAAVRVAYEGSAESIRSIARSYKVTDTAIHKKAKAEGWSRDGHTKKHIDGKVKALVEVQKYDEAEKAMPVAMRMQVNKQVMDRVQAIDFFSKAQNGLVEQLLGYLEHDRKIIDNPDSPIDPSKFGKAKIAQDIISAAKKNVLGDTPLMDAIEGKDKPDGDDDWIAVIPASEAKRLGKGKKTLAGDSVDFEDSEDTRS